MDCGFGLRSVCHHQETIESGANSLHNVADLEPDSV